MHRKTHSQLACSEKQFKIKTFKSSTLEQFIRLLPKTNTINVDLKTLLSTHNSNYRPNTNITPSMRCVVIDWMTEVSSEL